MTAGTGDGHAQKGLAKDVDLVVDAVGLIATRVHGRMLRLAQPPEASAEDGFVEFLLRMATRCGQQIAGDVLQYELIERHVLVERADDVVAVTPRLGDVEIELVS